MSEQDDRLFLQHIALVFVALALFALVIIFLAVRMDRQVEEAENPSQKVAREARIQPVFDVYAGDTGRAAALAAAERAGGGVVQKAAFGGSTDGEMIYGNVCQACHTAGAAGAPRLVAGDWEGRLDKGVDTLVDHAVNGFNAMPAKGGRSDLTREQVRAAVEYMLEQIPEE